MVIIKNRINTLAGLNVGSIQNTLRVVTHLFLITTFLLYSLPLVFLFPSYRQEMKEQKGYVTCPRQTVSKVPPLNCWASK